MSNEYKFVCMAVSETNYPFGRDSESRAKARLSGCIGQDPRASTRDGFVSEGLRYLRDFKQMVEEDISYLMEDPEPDEDLIDALHSLIEQAAEVDEMQFSALLAEEWDERHADDSLA